MSISQTRVTSNSVQFMDSSTTVAASLGTNNVTIGDSTPLNFLSINGYNNSDQSSSKYHGLELDGGRDNSTPIMRLLSESGVLTTGKRTAQFMLGNLMNEEDAAFVVKYQETVGDSDTDPTQESLDVTLGGEGTNKLTINKNSGSSAGNLILTNGTIQCAGGISFGSNNASATLTLANGSITDSSGAISFGDENLSTTGTLGCGVLTAATGSARGNLTLANGRITDSSGSAALATRT